MLNAFRKDVYSLVNVMEELGNLFEEESEYLLVLDSKEFVDPPAVKPVKKAQKIGQQQFQTFTKEFLVNKTNPIDDTIRRNRLKLFVGSTIKIAGKEVFIPYISSQLCSVSRVDFISNTSKDDSLKGRARAKRGKGVRRRVVGKAAVSGHWQNFLRAESNKTERIIQFLFQDPPSGVLQLRQGSCSYR